MSVVFPNQPIADKTLLQNILIGFWYNDALKYDPESWNIIKSFNNHQFRMLFDNTLEVDYLFKSFLLKSIKNCYGGSFFCPSNLSINNFLTDIRNQIRENY